MKKSVCYLIGLVVLCASCKKETNDTDFENADGVNGGMLYNTFWDPATGYAQTDAAKIQKLAMFSDFFKCKQCHGWDQEGNQASYIGRGPTKTRPRVATSIRTPMAIYTPEQLFNAIKTGSTPSARRPFSADLTTYDPATNNTLGDQMPNYGELLSDAQIWNIVKFLKTEAIDVKLLYDQTTTGSYPTGKITYANIGKDGDASRGKALFTSQGCASSSCHGANGTAILVDNATYTVGGFIKAKPNEAQHKIKFGQMENSGMLARSISVQDMKDLYKALLDTTAFPVKK